MSVGSKYAFLQFSDSTSATVDTGGATLTIGSSATGLPVESVRIVNASTATVFIGLGTRSTSSAAVTGTGIMFPPAGNPGAVGVIRVGGQTTLAAFTNGSTQTTKIYVTGGEGLAS